MFSKKFQPVCYLHPDTIIKGTYRRENEEQFTFFARTE
jgi:hypothetical protein